MQGQKTSSELSIRERQAVQSQWSRQLHLIAWTYMRLGWSLSGGHPICASYNGHDGSVRSDTWSSAGQWVAWISVDQQKWTNPATAVMLLFQPRLTSPHGSGVPLQASSAEQAGISRKIVSSPTHGDQRLEGLPRTLKYLFWIDQSTTCLGTSRAMSHLTLVPCQHPSFLKNECLQYSAVLPVPWARYHGHAANNSSSRLFSPDPAPERVLCLASATT